jgi:hypothetical protein
MSITIHAVKRLGALRPSDAASEEALRTIKDGETVRLEITRANRRSVQHHRLFFALLHVTAQQIDSTVEQLLLWCKIATGHADYIADRHGELTPVPRSISFEKMTQDEFNVFFDAAVKAILERLLPPGTPRSDLLEEVQERAAA